MGKRYREQKEQTRDPERLTEEWIIEVLMVIQRVQQRKDEPQDRNFVTKSLSHTASFRVQQKPE